MESKKLTAKTFLKQSRKYGVPVGEGSCVTVIITWLEANETGV